MLPNQAWRLRRIHIWHPVAATFGTGTTGRVARAIHTFRALAQLAAAADAVPFAGTALPRLVLRRYHVSLPSAREAPRRLSSWSVGRTELAVVFDGCGPLE